MKFLDLLAGTVRGLSISNPREDLRSRFWRRNHLRIPGLPPLADICNELFFVFQNDSYELLISRILMTRRPQHHLREYRREVNALRSQQINQFSPIFGVTFSPDDSIPFQSLQSVGQYIRRNPFIRSEKLLERPRSPQHHVANNQQRPAVSQHLNRCIQGTARTPFGLAARRCVFHRLITCILQVTIIISLSVGFKR